MARIFVATLPFSTGDHTFFVVLDATNGRDLVALAAEAQPIIDSLRTPATYVSH